MRIVVSPTAFKGTLGAVEAAEALSDAASEAIADAEVISLPIADGGDDTMRVLVDRLEGDVISASAMGPLGKLVDCQFGWLGSSGSWGGNVAVVEMASASGLRLVPEESRDPLRSTSRGTGDLIATVLERLPRDVIVGVGGSATSDGGAGIAEALGVLLIDSSGSAIEYGAEGLAALERIDLSGRNPLLDRIELIVACDVTNPLLGEKGAARTFGPQKGASVDDVEVIEAGLARLDGIINRQLGISIAEMPRAGAAGGAAGGMHALLGAELRDGFDVIAELIGFDEVLSSADLLIVGEGKLDEQSLDGKAAIAAARRAKRLGIPVWAFAGTVELSPEVLKQQGIEIEADLTELVGDLAWADPANALHTVARQMLGRAKAQGML